MEPIRGVGTPSALDPDALGIGETVSPETIEPRAADGWFDGGTMGVTPAEILAMLQLRLRDFDTQIGSIMEGLEDNGRRASSIAEELQARRELLEYVRGMEFEENGNIRWGQFDDDDDAADTLDDPSFGMDEAGNRIMALERGLVERLEALGMDVHGFNRTALQDSIERLNGELQEVNSHNEQMMIRMQTLMQSRTTAVQMVSNMLAAIDQGMDTIAGNVG